MSEMPRVQVAGVYHRRVGDLTITALSDGYLSGDVDIMRNIDYADARALLACCTGNNARGAAAPLRPGSS